MDLTTLFDRVHAAVHTARSPEAAWAGVLAAASEGPPLPAALRAWDATAEVAAVTTQLAALLTTAPPPPGLTFFYGGLVDLWDAEHEAEVASLYVAGGTATDAGAALAEADLPYRPEDGYLESALLQAIKTAGRAAGADYNVFDYGLMFGAGSLLLRFGLAALGRDEAVWAGFDSGDYAQVA